jgi:dihydrofolate synthase/folylpolyglutamate synthase
MPIETYEQALHYWYSRVNYEQRGMPADLRELKLDRMRALLDRLGRPEESLRIVHIAGSKGKGSIAAMLAAVLQRAGHRTGLFTSPHLTCVEERIQIGGQKIAPDELVYLMREIEQAVPAVEAQHSTPTFFEIVTALGFLHFARRQVELAVVEVGLGGRFDSTNVCDPLLAVISSISLDHTQQLGDTLAAIAGEKAGIIKPHRPTISGATAEEARAVIQAIARERHSPLQAIGRDFTCSYRPARITAQTCQRPVVEVVTRRQRWPGLELALLGAHQAANAAVVTVCVEELRNQGIDVPDEAVAAGLREVRWPARLEVLCRRPFVVLDCAHNVASIEALIDTLQTTFPPARRLLVFAGSRDKDLQGMLRLLVPQFERAFFTRYTSSQRGAPAAELAGLWESAGGRSAEVVEQPVDAWREARAAAGPADMICVTGSVFLAGELRPLLAPEAP